MKIFLGPFTWARVPYPPHIYLSQPSTYCTTSFQLGLSRTIVSSGVIASEEDSFVFLLLASFFYPRVTASDPAKIPAVLTRRYTHHWLPKEQEIHMPPKL
jgi:hypothetical protein